MNSNKIISIAIADDFPIVRKGLKEIIHDHPNLQCISEFDDGLSALEGILKQEPDIAILDIDMPMLNGLDVCKMALQKKVRTKFIILTMHRELGFYNEAMNIGVSGYLLKDQILNELITCIYDAHEGKQYLSSSLRDFLIQRESQQLKSDWARKYNLSISELNVLKLISEGKTTKEISDSLFVSEKTIETHRSNCVKKIGLEGGKNALLKFLLENHF